MGNSAILGTAWTETVGLLLSTQLFILFKVEHFFDFLID